MSAGSRTARVLRNQLRRRGPPQGRIRHHQDTFSTAHFELHIGGQVWKQLAVGVVGDHFDGIGDDVLRHRRVQSDLADLSRKNLAGVRIHRERHRLARLDIADVRLVDRHPHLHALKVLRDEEKARGIQAGHHGLPDVHPAVNNDPLDRRFDDTVAQVQLRPRHGRFRLGDHRVSQQDCSLAGRDVGFGAFISLLVGIIKALGQRIRRSDLLRPFPVALRLVQLRLQLLEIGFRAGDLGFGLLELGTGLGGLGRVGRVIDPRQHGSRFHFRAIVDRLPRLVIPEAEDQPGHLGTHVHHFFRLYGAGGPDRRHKIPALHGNGVEPHRGSLLPAHVARRDTNDQDNGDHADNHLRSFHRIAPNTHRPSWPQFPFIVICPCSHTIFPLPPCHTPTDPPLRTADEVSAWLARWSPGRLR